MNGYEIVFVQHLISSQLDSVHNDAVTLFWVYSISHGGQRLRFLFEAFIDKLIKGRPQIQLIGLIVVVIYFRIATVIAKVFGW